MRIASLRQVLQIKPLPHLCTVYWHLVASHLPDEAKSGELPPGIKYFLNKRQRRKVSSFGIGLKGMCISSVDIEWRSHEPKGCASLLSVHNDVHMNQRDVHLFCRLRTTLLMSSKTRWAVLAHRYWWAARQCEQCWHIVTDEQQDNVNSAGTSLLMSSKTMWAVLAHRYWWAARQCEQCWHIVTDEQQDNVNSAGTSLLMSSKTMWTVLAHCYWWAARQCEQCWYIVTDEQRDNVSSAGTSLLMSSKTMWTVLAHRYWWAARQCEQCWHIVTDTSLLAHRYWHIVTGTSLMMGENKCGAGHCCFNRCRSSSLLF